VWRSRLIPIGRANHLANERTFLAWVRTGAAIVVFGFAIGRFSIALRQLTALQEHTVRGVGISVVMGSFTIVAGAVDGRDV
jgi:inner membrane protein YidH